MAIQFNPETLSRTSEADFDVDAIQNNASRFEFLSALAGRAGDDPGTMTEDADTIELQLSRITSVRFESPSTLSPETASLPGEAWSGRWFVEDVTHEIDG